MSIAPKILTVLTLAVSPLTDAPPKVGSPEWKADLQRYSKEMVTSIYTVRLCKSIYPNIRKNDDYFQRWAPPLMGSEEENAETLRPYMVETKAKLEKQNKKFGTAAFCPIVIKFLQQQAAPDGPPVLID
jgi:hypothetical protein